MDAAREARAVAAEASAAKVSALLSLEDGASAKRKGALLREWSAPQEAAHAAAAAQLQAAADAAAAREAAAQDTLRDAARAFPELRLLRGAC
jgi:hypothetical protein